VVLLLDKLYVLTSSGII